MSTGRRLVRANLLIPSFFSYFLSTDLKYDCHKDDTLNRYVRHIRVKVAGLKEFVHT
jgi:hypothetical protein